MSYFGFSDQLPAWAADLPSDWKKDWLKWSVRLHTDKPTDSEKENLPYISNEDISSWTGQLTNDNPQPGESDGRKFQIDDVLLNKLRPYLAKVYHAKFDGISSGELLCLRASKSVLPRYLFFVVSSRVFIDSIDAETFGSKMPRADWEIVGHQPLPLPPLETQRRIAQFLDEKTARIDGLIEKKKALLEKLAEKRQALITRAVTKGLNPDAPTKPSGIDWLGDIPAHWEVMRLRFIMTTNPSKREVRLNDDDLVSFVPMEAVAEFGGLNLEQERELSEISSGYTYFADNDVVLAKITPCFENGKGSIASGLKNGVAFGTTELHVLRGNSAILPEYLFNIVMSHPFAKIGESEMYGSGGQKRIPENFLRNFKMGIPDLTEQHQITEYINQINGFADLQAEKTKKSVKLLEEYRSALITSAVTGKLEVP